MAQVSDDELKAAVEALYAASGNVSEAARRLKLHRHTYKHRLETAQTRLGMQIGKIADGRIDYVKSKKKTLPPKGKVARYLLTSAQNNTHHHKEGWQNLLAYRKWLARRGDTCEILIGTYSYQIDAYGAKAVKRGKKESEDHELWYDPELEPYFCDESTQLAPGLIWCGEQNILPTALDPLKDFATYNGRNSNVVPHAKHALESVPSLPDEATKLNYTTGSITLRNYIQKRAGIRAEREHCYGAVIVEVDSNGNWYVRQLTVDEKGDIYDIGPTGYRSVKVADSQVAFIRADAPATETMIEAVNQPDVHESEMLTWVRELLWGTGGLVDQFAPKRQFLHDLFSMRSRSHHEQKDFFRTFQKHVDRQDIVEDEVNGSASFLRQAVRKHMETVVIRSNHDRHLDRWLDEFQVKYDPGNVRYFTKLQHARLKAYEDGDRDFNVLEYALREAGCPDSVYFNGEDESYVICKYSRTVAGIECGLHGDLGPNGAPGSSRNLTKLARPVNKGHDHTASIKNLVYSAGSCALNLPYEKGPTAHTVSLIVTFENAARQILTCWKGKARA